MQGLVHYRIIILDDTVRNLPIEDWYDVDPFNDK